jgi:hypothetical protein
MSVWGGDGEEVRENGKWKMDGGVMRVLVITALILSAVSVALAVEPASQPAGERSMAKDLFHLTDPGAPWGIVDYRAEGDAVLYVTDSHDGEMQVALLPKNASVDAGIADNVAVAIIKKIRADRAKAGVKVVMAAKSEKDSRFAVRIHEKYMAGDKTVDQLHVYKSVGPRVLMLTVSSLADDADVAAAELKAGEDLLLSAKFNRKAFKPDR